ncbi:unnamed protein product [Caenorhabditis sp. 36 PRJEB53466]|nr:unnamed protein product [Caenorhabditis sp. 36 PRJEB53466]
MLLLLSLFLFFSVSPVAAQYDVFTFNVTMMCRHEVQFTYDATFNIRYEEPDRPIQYGAIGSVNSVGNAGFNRFVVSGFFEFELSRAPVWEPIARINHNCVAKGVKKYKKIMLNFASVPAVRKKVNYVYKFQIDITDKEGNFLPEAEITTA